MTTRQRRHGPGPPMIAWTWSRRAWLCTHPAVPPPATGRGTNAPRRPSARRPVSRKDRPPRVSPIRSTALEAHRPNRSSEQDRAALPDNHRDGVHHSRASPARSAWDDGLRALRWLVPVRPRPGSSAALIYFRDLAQSTSRLTSTPAGNREQVREFRREQLRDECVFPPQPDGRSGTTRADDPVDMSGTIMQVKAGRFFNSD